ncbi:GNAT family N-acetyltransferase [Amorphus sp. MBR-141]
MTELATERLALRPFQPEDRPWLAALMRDPAVFFWERQPVCDAADDAEISWHLLPRFWGQGFATEGACAVLDHAMHVVRPERVVAFALPDNIRSLRVIRRVGLPYIADRHHAGRPHAFFALSRKAYLTAAPASSPKTGHPGSHA